jgi:hypothetical protein
MKELGLQQLLRYALPGGIGFAVLLFTYPEIACQIQRLETGKEATLILGSALLLGAMVYNLHRALLFPPLFRLVSRLTLEPKPEGYNPYRPSVAELKVDRWRWKIKNKEERQRWDEWGAQTHFLYCAAWAITGALAVGYFVTARLNLEVLSSFALLAVTALLAAIVNNYRLLYSISAEMKLPQDAVDAESKPAAS